jgi:lipoprotein-releasing system ATP-binding protein
MSDRYVPGEPLVQVDDLHRVFFHQDKQLHVLRGVRLTVRRGEMIAVVGESGVGKSTLLQILGTLDHPTSGAVRFGDVDVFRFTEAELASFRNRTIGFVFQFHHLLPEFSALENVVMPALIARLPRAEALERGERLLRDVGLSERMTHRPGELSGGEQQRVALARALVMDPQLVLADEPTGNLDERTSEEIHDLFVDLNRRTHVTFMIVTHNRHLAARMTRTLLLEGGAVRELEGAA